MNVAWVPSALSELLRELWTMLPRAALSLSVVWVVVFGALAVGLRWLKHHVKARVLRADDRIRAWALALRYRGQDVFGSERVPLTWFMRFWTNFASAPCLSILSLLVPLWLGGHGRHGYDLRLWLLPGLCFCGSMLLSNILKRVFKRVRPVRAPGSFGHKMSDGSFPSGHSLTSFVFWATMTLTLALAGVPISVVVPFAVAAVIIVGFTGLSRVYMGVHFPSDVIGGYFIGAIWSLVSYPAISTAL